MSNDFTGTKQKLPHILHNKLFIGGIILIDKFAASFVEDDMGNSKPKNL